VLSKLLSLPEIERIDFDTSDRIAIHRKVFQQKRMLREVMGEFHQLFWSLDHKYFGSARGSRVEIGAGVAPMKQSFPEVLATDLVAAPYLDLQVDAQEMDLPSDSVRALYCQNCFHHFPEPQRFFSEVIRVVVSGGGAILIEPYYGPIASFMYKRLFATEGFDKTMPGWEAPTIGPMSGANQALSYIMFRRDRQRFQEEFPSLDIVSMFPLKNYVRYLLSGGLNFRQLAPNFSIPLLKLCEFLAAPLAPVLALHHVIILRKSGLVRTDNLGPKDERFANGVI